MSFNLPPHENPAPIWLMRATSKDLESLSPKKRAELAAWQKREIARHTKAFTDHMGRQIAEILRKRDLMNFKPMRYWSA